MIEKSPSKNLRRFGRDQLIVQIMLAAVGFWFCAAAAIKDTDVMNPDVYGYLITSVKAEWWSWPIFVVSLIYILGILINGNWRWSPVLRLFGSVFHVLTLGLFSALSLLATSASVYTEPFPATTAIACGINVWFMILNIGDTYRAVKVKR